MAVGVYFFKIPNGFSTGGVSGLATVLGKLQGRFTPGQLIPIFNVFLLVIGFFVLGGETGVKTVYCSLLYSFLTWMLEVVCPLTQPLTDQPFLELVYGTFTVAVGSALMFNCHASSGGTDITALILKKYTNIDSGKALLYVDAVIAVSSFFVFDIRTGLYSCLGLYAKSFLVDSVIENINESKCFMIISDHHEEIIDYLINVLNRSATSYDAVGEYSKEPKKVVIALCDRIQAMRLKRKLKEIDPKAFIVVTSTSDIIGKGFHQN